MEVEKVVDSLSQYKQETSPENWIARTATAAAAAATQTQEVVAT